MEDIQVQKKEIEAKGIEKEKKNEIWIIVAITILLIIIFGAAILAFYLVENN